jgi:CRP-like cAMP-binding protein
MLGMRSISRSPDAVQAALRAHPLFAECSGEFLASLCAESKLLGYEPGELILEERQEATTSFALLEGSVRVFFSSSEGAQVMAKLFSAPAFFGEMESLLGISFLEGVEVLQPTVVLAIPRGALEGALKASHSFCYQLMLDLCARLCVAARNQSSLAFAQVESRLAAFLIGYLERFGEKVNGVLVPSRPITQDALAEAVGATPRSIQRALNEWKELGIVKGRGRQLKVLDVAALYRMAGEDPARIDYRIGEVFGRPLAVRSLR